MAHTYRIEVALKDARDDVDGASVLTSLRDLGVTDVTSVRAVRVYDVRGELTEDDAHRLARELFADPIVDTYAVNAPALDETGLIGLDVVRKSGVMDPVQASAIQGAREVGVTLDAVRTVRRYLFAGSRSAEELASGAAKVIANAVIEDVIAGRNPFAVRNGTGYALEKIRIPLRAVNDEALLRISREGQLYLTLVEMQAIQAHYRGLGREPADVELETIAQTWSEHCMHKTLRGAVRLEGEGAAEFKSLLKETIVEATNRIGAPWCWSVFKDNAGVIEFDGEMGVCFKVETHNHPSAIEPYGGAGTGLGGVIRDILGTGLGAMPIANTDVFCFAPLDTPHDGLPAGVLHPQRVMKGVVSGVRDYGNRMGIPTVSGAVLFDERYLGNPLVYCGTIGTIPHSKVDKSPRAGDLIVVAGGATGRDGIHGATFSSGELTEDSEMLSSGAVQIGNPIEEKKLLEAVLAARAENLFTSITDCGAGGLSSAVGEMGEHLGAEVDLDRVPLKYAGLSYTEIWISEAQERMVLAVPPGQEARLIELFAAEEVEATVIGRFGDDRVLRLRYGGELVGELDMEFLHHGLPPVMREARWSPPAQPKDIAPAEDLAPGEILHRILASPNVCSKEWVIRQYDHEVQAGTVIKPLLGPEGDGPSDAAVIAPLTSSHRAVAVGCGINPRYGDLDPYRMAASAIDEAVRNVVAVGARPDRIALLDNFSWGNTEKPDRLGALVRACQACRDVAIAYGTPFISGKDSLNNEYQAGDRVICIPHTLLISAIGIVDDYRQCVTMDAKAAGNPLYLVGKTLDEPGGGHYHKVTGRKGGSVPGVDLGSAPAVHARTGEAIASGAVRACHDLSEGGLAVSAAEMAFAGGLGIEMSLDEVPVDDDDDPLTRLFSESNTRYLVEVAAEREEAFAESFRDLPCARIGAVIEAPVLRVRAGGKVILEERTDALKSSWLGTLTALDR